MPKNLGVAPQYDTWNQKYEPWELLRSTARLAGTGFYIPPEWYHHFRMFPPIQHNFLEEQTQNPQAESEPTQAYSTVEGERAALRDELGRRSRLLAGEGNRYFSLFWVRRPLDEAERRYYALRAAGCGHEAAVQGALEAYHRHVSCKKRIATIQSEEARLSGNFITMHEATAVLGALAHVERKRLSSHDAADLAETRRKQAATRGPQVGEVRDDAVNPVHVYRTDDVGTVTLQEGAAAQTGDAAWYTGASPFLDLDADT